MKVTFPHLLDELIQYGNNKPKRDKSENIFWLAIKRHKYNLARAIQIKYGHTWCSKQDDTFMALQWALKTKENILKKRK